MEPLDDQTVVSPKEAVLQCMISAGSPSAQIHWYRDSREIRESSKYEMSYMGEIAQLVIHPTEPHDAATYRVEAANKIGRVQSEATLDVQSKHNIIYPYGLLFSCDISGALSLVFILAIVLGFIVILIMLLL